MTKSRLKAIFHNERLILTLIAAYPLLFIWQGLDFTDTGYTLANFQQIFTDPTSVASSFRIWLTNILGGIWVYFFGDLLGLTGFRLAAVLLVYATLYLSYLTLKPYLKRTHLLWGLFSALIFINRSGYLLNYNSFTAFFYVAGSYFLLKGLIKRDLLTLAVAGFILGLSIFIRLPNVLGLALGMVIFFYGYLKKTSPKELARQMLFFASGALVAIVFTLLIMFLLGHLESYLTAFKGTFAMLKDPVGHHRSDKLVEAFVRHHKTMVHNTGLLMAGLIGLGVVLSICRMLKIHKVVSQAIILAAGAALFYSFYGTFQDSDWVNMLIITVGVLYSTLAYLTMGLGTKALIKEVRLAALVALLVLFVAPLGSNVAIRNSIFGMYLAIPLVFGFFAELKDVRFSGNLKQVPAGRLSLSLCPRELLSIKTILLLFFLLFSLQSGYYYTYRDAADRFSMTYTVEHPRLKGVFTTRERAKVVGELLKVLPQYVQEGDYLLAYEQIPMIHFLTKTRPYLYSTWPMLYSPGVFREALQRAILQRPDLPPIVRAKGNTEKFSWPKGREKLIRSAYHDQNRQAVEYFIRLKNYRVVWENEFFEILLPTSDTSN